jgi:hypothetical protein
MPSQAPDFAMLSKLVRLRSMQLRKVGMKKEEMMFVA